MVTISATTSSGVFVDRTGTYRYVSWSSRATVPGVKEIEFISSVTSFGIFVELKDIYIEGLVHVTSLGNDYYHYDPTRHWLMGERTRRIYRLGDTVVVNVVQVNLDERKIDLELVEKGSVNSRRRKKKGR